MPKINFNQFLDECENFRTAENKIVSKISFETPSNYHDDEDQNKNQGQNMNDNTPFSESGIKSSTTSSSNRFSSNIFLSKSAVTTVTNENRFSSKGLKHNVGYKRENTTTESVIKENNIFKKMETTQPAVQGFTAASSHVVEINNDTFPSLVSATTTATATTAVPKKFKNFKDAICAPVAQPAPSSIIKQTHIKATATNNSHHSSGTHPPPLVVKKDSELYAKKILAKTKKIPYDDDDDDDYGEDDEYRIEDNTTSEHLYKSHYKQTFIKRRCSHENSDSDE